MEKKFYNVFYSNVNVEGNDEGNVVSGYESYRYSNRIWRGYFFKGYKQEARYRDKEVSGRWGTKKIKEEYFVTVGYGELTTYVEEVDGKYYDIITGTEAIPEVYTEAIPGGFVYWPSFEKKDGKYYNHGKEVDKDNVESKVLKFKATPYNASLGEVYSFLKNLTDEDIELYCQRMKQALANIPKVQERRMSIILGSSNKKREQEDFVSNFRENYGFGRNRTR